MAETSPSIEGLIYGTEYRLHQSQSPNQPRAEKSFLPVSATERFCNFAISLALILMPLLFGSVHFRSETFFQLLIFSALGLSLRTDRAGYSGLLGAPSFTRSMFRAMSLFLMYISVQYLALRYHSSPHPVLGSAGGVLSVEGFARAFKGTLFFTSSFILVRYFLTRAETNSSSLIAKLILISSLIGAIGLMHWFYDNGKLFWVFAPETSENSTRARWPFVSPNNYGHFCMLGLFLSIGVFVNQLRSILVAVRDQSVSVSNYVASRSFQRSLFRIALVSLSIVVLGSGLLGSLSRGSWLGTALGLVVFLACGKIVHDTKAPRTPENVRHLHDYSRRRRHPSPFKRFLQSWFVSGVIRYSRILVLVISLGLVYLFLSDRGAELLSQRIDYGLLYSKYDIRWQLFSDTASMISEYPLFGVGLGAWASAYPPYMSNLLAGLNPVYLHSDPLQLIAEVGVVGCLPILGIVILTAFFSIRFIRTEARYEEKILLLAMVSGLTALCMASFLDFPFKIPALSFYAATYLALLAHKFDRSQ